MRANPVQNAQTIATSRDEFRSGARASSSRPKTIRIPIAFANNLQPLPTQSRAYELGKRAFDFSIALLFLPLTAIVVGSIGLAMAMTTGGPIFYRQERIGRYGRPFRIWKLRTMHIDGKRILDNHLRANSDARDEWDKTHKLRNDPRITSLGRWLRATSFDELPQILNILAGHMSFVGPRPIVKKEIPKYASNFPFYLAARPGVTGLWQVSGRCSVSYETRVMLDVAYVQHWTMTRDLWILMKTPGAVLRQDGAY